MKFAMGIMGLLINLWIKNTALFFNIVTYYKGERLYWLTSLLLLV